MPDSIKYKSIIKCPVCKFKKELQMKSSQHIVFYKCPECEAVLKPKGGDCCVICSYGSIPCPNSQESGMKEGGSPSA